MYNYNYSEDYLMHYGVKGMKWGVRAARGHAGPGVYLNRKRQLSGDKRDLETLNKGGHLSVGMTKKRQVALDARDKAVLEKRIAKNEKMLKSDQPVKELSKTEKVTKGLKVAENILNSTGGPNSPKVKILPTGKLETHAERSRRESMERKNQLGKAPTLSELRKRRDRNNI